MAFSRVGRKLHGLLEFRDGLLHLSFAGEDNTVNVMAVGVFRRDLDSLRQLLDGFIAMAGDFEQVAEVDVRRAVVRIERDGLLNLNHRLIKAASFGKSAAEIVVGLRTVVVHRERLLVSSDGFSGFAAGRERYAHIVPGARVRGIFIGSHFPCGNGVSVFVRVLQLLCRVELAVEVDGRVCRCGRVPRGRG